MELNKNYVAELVAEEMNARDWTTEDLIAESKLRRSSAESIIKGDVVLSVTQAMCLARAFGTSVVLWMNLSDLWEQHHDQAQKETQAQEGQQA